MLDPKSSKGGVSHVVPVQLVQHPLVQHHVACLRDVATPCSLFRAHLRNLATLLAYEATRDLRLAPRSVTTPLQTVVGQQLDERVGLVPILRAGLGMVDSLLDLMPSAEVWHLGLYRDEATATPVEYYRKLPAADPVDVAMVLDPMLATGGSATAALATLTQWGVRRMKLLAIIGSKQGIAAVQREFPDVEIYVCAVDADLNGQKFIVPGLGDAGDRIFNTQRSTRMTRVVCSGW